jgi:RNA polymerase sigma factor (sigma-70 family)
MTPSAAGDAAAGAGRSRPAPLGPPSAKPRRGSPRGNVGDGGANGDAYSEPRPQACSETCPESRTETRIAPIEQSTAGSGRAPGRWRADDPGDWITSAVQRLQGPLILYVARWVRETERARDVVQDAFLRLCEQDRSAVEPHLAEWLYTVCRNKALDVVRKESRVKPMDEHCARSITQADLSPAHAVEQKESASRILRMLDRLPKNQQECIRLKFQGGLSYKQIAGVTKLSVTNVGFLIHTGLKNLRERLNVAPESARPRGARP